MYTSYPFFHCLNEVEIILVENERDLDFNCNNDAQRKRGDPLGDISNISDTIIIRRSYQQISQEVALKWLEMGATSNNFCVTSIGLSNVCVNRPRSLATVDSTDTQLLPRCTRLLPKRDGQSSPTTTYTGTSRNVRTTIMINHERSHKPRPVPLSLDLQHQVKMAGSHWKSAEDPKSGRTYYYHEITRETQWLKPTELASEAERKTMEEKERKQKDFFAAMEANILNSLSQGQVPGTSNPSAMQRRKSSHRPAERPELVRTISTMDDIVLKNMIQRQPSFRNMSKNGLSKTMSLNPNDFENEKRPSHIGANDFESFVSLMSEHTRRLDPLQEASVRDDDSLPELFSYLPDEGDFSVSESSFRSDGGKLNESSLTGFGLTWEETQALKKLASITKEMIQAEKEEEIVEGKNGVTASWKAKDNKGLRDLPREIELDESDEESDSVPETSATVPPFQKAKNIGGRDLDFDSEEEDETADDMAPTPIKNKTQKTKSPVKKDDRLPQRPEIKRRNTCSTLYVGTTMSAPDKDANIKVRIPCPDTLNANVQYILIFLLDKCVCGVIRTHILSSNQLPHDPGSDEYRIFNDLESDQTTYSLMIHNDKQTQASVPSLEEVTRFYRDIFYKAQMEADCIIMSLIYVERLVKRTGGRLRPRAENWRSLMFSCMILSSKVWDDLSMWNADFSQSCPPGISFSLQRINELELAVLNTLSFQVKVPASEYAKYYFLLRSMLIKSGLGGEDTNALDPLDVMGARRLQQVSSQFENLSLGSKPIAVSQRSQSLNVAAMNAKQRTGTKLGLEQVVKM